MAREFDDNNRYVIKDYSNKRPFASFLPGIAGENGIPLWSFYVNRGQAITSFGVADKNHPIVEFQPANKAYQTTAFTGFRTFIKLKRAKDHQIFYEPFASCNLNKNLSMHIGMNELEITEVNSTLGLQTNVLYFTLPEERFAGLVRLLTLKNIGGESISIEILDGLPAVIPYGVNNFQLKEFGRTIEAWMGVYNLERNIPFFRVRASIEDKAEVKTIKSGHFSLAFTVIEGESQLCRAFVDPKIIFKENTSLSTPDHFIHSSLDDINQDIQITFGKTPCSFFGNQTTIGSQDSVSIISIYGHISSVDLINREFSRLQNEEYIARKRKVAQNLALDLTSVIETNTSESRFDAYCRQTYLDNLIRGGNPQIIRAKDRSFVYHLYSRKHGDIERDYNAFYLAPEYFSQGNGNYRDVNQNRRSDVLFNPKVAEFNIHAFMSLIQADGYNPLIIKGSKFTVPAEHHDEILKVINQEDLQYLLLKPFSLGELIDSITDHHNLKLNIPIDGLLSLVLQKAKQEFQADFHEGYWTDHWTYNLDLIDSFLAVFPDKKEFLLFEDCSYYFFDSQFCVNPREKKYVISNGKPVQLNAIFENEVKKDMIASRKNEPNLLRTKNGKGEIYQTSLISKLFLLVLLKFSTADPWGMGIEMEAGRPGWYDAMNGLPGLFGSSMPETFELKRLLEFLLSVSEEFPSLGLNIPLEANNLLDAVLHNLKVYMESENNDRDFIYWDSVSNEREKYRFQIQFGFEGQEISISLEKLSIALKQFLKKIDEGIQRALELNAGLSPTYFHYQVDKFEYVLNADNQPETDSDGHPNIRVKKFTPVVLPLFLEGFVRALKVSPPDHAKTIYEQVKSSELFDQKLKMYKVNESLKNQPHDIGRARAFTPGWLENESIWLHMEYKYLLEVLKAGLYDQFFEDFKNVIIPFLDAERYARSPAENSSFLVSSAHPDSKLHGVGFVARLSGSTAEFLSIWFILMAGKAPFFLKDGQLNLQFKPTLPGWLFNAEGLLSFRFLGQCWVTYHNPLKENTYSERITTQKVILQIKGKPPIEISGGLIPPYLAEMVRCGEVKNLDIFLDSNP
jgi:hypothetical protein